MKAKFFAILTYQVILLLLMTLSIDSEIFLWEALVVFYIRQNMVIHTRASIPSY